MQRCIPVQAEDDAFAHEDEQDLACGNMNSETIQIRLVTFFQRRKSYIH
jgi:hypothetical protein